MAKHEQIQFTLEYGMDVISSALEHLNEEVSKRISKYPLFPSSPRHRVGPQRARDDRALDEHAEIVDARRRWAFAVTEQPLRAHLVRLHYEIAPLLPVDSSSDRGLR